MLCAEDTTHSASATTVRLIIASLQFVVERRQCICDPIKQGRKEFFGCFLYPLGYPALPVARTGAHFQSFPFPVMRTKRSHHVDPGAETLARSTHKRRLML